jgi:hypothetical protein
MKLAELVWHGQHMERGQYDRWYWIDTPNPVGGETVSMGSLGMQYVGPGETATHYEIPVTAWGDYFGDGVSRSNYRSLLRDFPDTFVEVKGDYFSQYLAIPVDSLTDELLDIATGLVEQYPLYDEEDHSELETEELDEQLGDWIISDIRSDLRREHGKEDAFLSDDTIRELFYEWLSDANEYPYLEDAVTIYVPDLDSFVKQLADTLEDAQ